MKAAWILLAVASVGCSTACTCSPARRSAAACDGILCSGHGKCAVVRGDPTCACDPGFRPEGLNCLPLEGAVALAPAVAPLAAPHVAGAGSPGEPPPAPDAQAAGAAPKPADAAPAPPAAPPEDPVHRRLCLRVLMALTQPPSGGYIDLVTAAKRDAIARYQDAISASCTAFLREADIDEPTIACAIEALETALRSGVDLGTLARRDPQIESCGIRWKEALGAHATAFGQMLDVQRDRFGVAVFGFHRMYRFEGGATEEFCRRFLLGVPDAPASLLGPIAGISPEWQERLVGCAQVVGGAVLAPLLRWCLVDRSATVFATGSAAVCERYAKADELDGLRRIAAELLALTQL